MKLTTGHFWGNFSLSRTNRSTSDDSSKYVVTGDNENFLCNFDVNVRKILSHLAHAILIS